jgi:ABC-type nitrate/sulfonate/bicarbonate transport system permease component
MVTSGMPEPAAPGGLPARRWRAARAFVFPLGLLALLEAWARTAGRASDALAPPTRALQAFGTLLAEGQLVGPTAFTLGSAALGLALAALAALPLGTLLGLSRRAGAAAFLTVEALRPVPSVALIPLAMLVFGFGVRMEVGVVAFATFWPMLVLTQAAARQVEPQLLEVSAALQLEPAARFAKVVLPAMVPRLFVALRLGTAIALVVAVTVEIAANPHGMGYAMMIAQQSLDPATMLAWLAWIGAVGWLVNAGTLALQRRVARRMGEAPAGAGGA